MELARRAEKALGQAYTQEQRIDTIALWIDLAAGELTEQILQDTTEFSKQLIRAVVGEIIERPLERDAD
jgi:hypothetical protein